MFFQAKAIEALQHAAEDYLVLLFTDVSLLRRFAKPTAVAYYLPSQVNLQAIHGKRITIAPKDIQVRLLWQLYRAAAVSRES